ncbi:hypothetical protein IEQ34_021959 [Dendrobium chrysotoxum]|uniref:Uncharacterized protein n=1 Tax=Dendrobium chrysotoxum TaxID=161865 RepID=A0AAV7FXM4_DENCH|nr:hypothetical protein IEQ34_021959 [Dendrobium chrysotoxum]
MRERKNWHWACPMVWAPESAVMSRALRPFAANLVMRVERVDDGAGRSLFAVLWLAEVASLRPRATVHFGPPNCTSLNDFYIF